MSREAIELDDKLPVLCSNVQANNFSRQFSGSSKAFIARRAQQQQRGVSALRALHLRLAMCSCCLRSCSLAEASWERSSRFICLADLRSSWSALALVSASLMAVLAPSSARLSALSASSRCFRLFLRFLMSLFLSWTAHPQRDTCQPLSRLRWLLRAHECKSASGSASAVSVCG